MIDQDMRTIRYTSDAVTILKQEGADETVCREQAGTTDGGKNTGFNSKSR